MRISKLFLSVAISGVFLSGCTKNDSATASPSGPDKGGGQVQLTSASSPGQVICDFLKEFRKAGDPGLNYTINSTTIKIPDCAAAVPQVEIKYQDSKEMDFRSCGEGNDYLNTFTGFSTRDNYVYYSEYGNYCGLASGDGWSGYRRINRNTDISGTANNTDISATVDKNELKVTVTGEGKFIYQEFYKPNQKVNNKYLFEFSVARISIGSEPIRNYGSMKFRDETQALNLLNSADWQ